MMNKNPRFNNLEDLRAWKMLKKHELELEKLKLEKARDSFKDDMVQRASKYFFIELAMVFGEKMMISMSKKFFGKFLSRLLSHGGSKKIPLSK